MASLRVTVDEEMGYKHALKALWINFHDIDSEVDYDKMAKRAMILCNTKDISSGELKFLSMITVNLTIDAPLSFWSHYDTYKVGVVMSSESKMHTLGKGNLSLEKDIYSDTINTSLVGGEIIDLINSMIEHKADIEELNDAIPLSFMQGRVITTNYLSIANVVSQRKNHKIKKWRYFINKLLLGLEHYELICAASKIDESGVNIPNIQK